MQSAIYLLFVCILIIPNGHGSSLDVYETKEAHGLLQQTLKALKGTVEFFKKEYKHVNLDAIIGTRIVEGTLKVLLQHIDTDFDAWPLDSDTLDKIKDIQKLTQEVNDNALPYVAVTDPPYYARIGTLIQRGFWEFDFASKDFSIQHMKHAWNPRPGEVMHERDSDDCLTELFGTGPNSKTKCHISSQCWSMMTKPGYSGYSLTHQVFYLQIAYQMKCYEAMNKHQTLLRQPPPSEILDQMCAAIFVEAKDIEDKHFPQLKQDLFMEQAALCGIMGYRMFFTAEWLQVILSWQDQHTGCFKGQSITESQVEFREDRQCVRLKREERRLEGGCLCHRTTVAASALVTYVRYIAEFEQFTFQNSQKYQ